MGGKNNKLCDQRGQDPKGGQACKETHKRNPAAGQKHHFKCFGLNALAHLEGDIVPCPPSWRSTIRRLSTRRKVILEPWPL